MKTIDEKQFIDKACEFWHKALVDDKDPYKSMWLALIDKFRKEMTTIDSLVDDLALNDMADAAFKERTADMSIPILADSNFFFKEGFVMGYNQAKAIYYQHMIYLADACEHDKKFLVDKACEWIEQHGYTMCNAGKKRYGVNLEQFRKAMKGERE